MHDSELSGPLGLHACEKSGLAATVRAGSGMLAGAAVWPFAGPLQAAAATTDTQATSAAMTRPCPRLARRGPLIARFNAGSARSESSRFPLPARRTRSPG